MTRILLVSGSTREESLHAAALRTAARLVPPEITAARYDGLRDLPAFVPGAVTAHLAVTALRGAVRAADAVLFCTPQYAGSLPGSLKNLLDWLVDGGELDGKPAAWLSVAPPGQDEGAYSTLETVLAHGNARLLRPACIRTPLTLASVDARGLVTDPSLHMALRDMLEALTRAIAAAARPRQPSWQAHSSLYPVIQRQDASTPTFRTWRPPS